MQDFEVLDHWTISIDWEKKCVNINLHYLHKKIELSIKEVQSIKNCMQLLQMREKGLL